MDEVDKVSVSRLKDDLFIVDKRSIDIDIQAIHSPQWRHGADLAVREEIFELLFGR
jgi:hypothetical protein